MSVSIGQFSFTGGEWMPSLEFRTDLAKYMTSALRMENFFSHKHGETSNRPGFEFVVRTKDNAKKTYLAPFQFSVIQSYMLQFSDLSMRVLKDGGQVVSPIAVTGAADNGGGKIRLTVTAHGFQTGNTVTVAGVIGTTEANGTDTITVIDADHIDLDSSTFTNTYIGGGTATAIVEIATPWAVADLPKLKYRQSADTIYFTHPSYPRYKITRTSHTAWVLTQVTSSSSLAAPANFAGTGSARTFAVTAVTEDGVESVPSATDTADLSTTLSWDSVTGASEYRVYQVVNGVYQFVGRSATTSFALPSSISPDDTQSAPQAFNPFPTAGQYPGCLSFYKQRLYFARTNQKPQSVWGSRVGDFENNNRQSPVADDGAFSFTVDTGLVNEILWMEALKELILGMSSEEYKLSSDDNSVTGFKSDFQSAWGVCDIQPIKIGNTLLFVDGSQAIVRDLTYDLTSDGYTGSDLTVLAQHLFQDSKIVTWCYQKYPNPIIWAVREDGVACGLTYLREHDVIGWCRLVTDGVIEDMKSITTAPGVSEVYAVVARQVGGGTVRYVEKLNDRKFATKADAFFVDCGLTYAGAPASVFSGLEHLEGREVGALADGNWITGLTVTGGQITLPAEFSKVHIGIPYTCRFMGHGFTVPTRSGTGQDKTQTCTEVTVALRDTGEMWAGSDGGKMYEAKLRTTEGWNETTALFTGKKKMSINPSRLGEVRVKIETYSGLPITISGIVPAIAQGG